VGGIVASWAGGKKGREVLDRLLPVLPDVLSAKGLFYLVAVKENDPEDIHAIMAKSGFVAEKVAQRQVHNEDLRIYRYSRPGAPSQLLPVES